MTRQKGFTLIELLVVIAIIAILAAILFPVFARAKAKAQETQCLSNVKQIATAVHTYVADWDSRLPWEFLGEWTDTSTFDITHIWNTLTPYLKTVDILQCPVGPEAVPLGEIPGVNFLSASYAFNSCWWGKDDLFPADQSDTNCQIPTRIMAVPATGYYFRRCIGDPMDMTPRTSGTHHMAGHSGQALSLDECDNPAGAYMLWDAEMITDNCASGLTAIWDLDVYSWLSAHAFRDIAGGSSCAEITPVLRHNKGLNVAFFDGHAKRQSRSQTEAVMGWDWDNY